MSTGKSEAAGAIATASTGVVAGVLSLVSAACCVSPVLAPILVTVLGAGGVVWAANLKPYSGWILAGSLICLLAGFWLVYRPRQECSLPATRSTRILRMVALASLWLGSTAWAVGLALRILLP